MKSHISDFLELWRTIYLDACANCVADVSKRDISTTISRVKEEGLSFLTITLPRFARDFERSLEQGYIDPTAFQNFRKVGSYPAFLQGMIGLIFDRDSGRINDVKNYDSPDTFSSLVCSVRQICLAFKKVELPCTPEREHAALENFIVTEQSFEMLALSPEDIEAFASVSSLLWGHVLRNLRLDKLVPRHGPGATADRVSGNQKYRWRFWHDRLEPFLPLIDSGFPISCGEFSVYGSELQRVSILSSDEELPVRVTPVPKTLKGPRIIAIEPCCMQYAQQGIRNLLYEVIESDGLTAGHINFRDQSINQRLAKKSSIDRGFATIDLSDASDRVPLDLALSMFDQYPDVRDFVNACRSTTAEMPDGRIVGPLRKFASMGSALCFPVEAMYFYTICVVALLKSQNLPVTFSSLRRVGKSVYVYGDDIVVPRKHATIILDYLAKYNCKINTDKTFYRGFFRESCGVDAFLGREVQPIYVGTRMAENKRQSSEILSTVATANLFYKRGYYRTSLYLFDRVETITGPLPTCDEDSHVIGRNHFWHPLSTFKQRWNEKYQRLESLVFVPTPVYRTDRLEGFAALQKCLLKLEGLNPEPYKTRSFRSVDPLVDYIDSLVAEDVKHLERTARHGVVAIQRRWVPVRKTGFGRSF